MARTVAIGIQDFEYIRTNNYFYIDIICSYYYIEYI